MLAAHLPCCGLGAGRKELELWLSEEYDLGASLYLIPSKAVCSWGKHFISLSQGSSPA